jgi:hypothetical protein
MGLISVAAFRPRAGKEQELLKVVADRLPLLRRLGMCTDRKAILMRSREGLIIQVSEWKDVDAIHRAHETPEVLELWKRFSACCEYVKLESLSESHDDFATFEAIDA